MFRRRTNGQASLDNLVEMIHLTTGPLPPMPRADRGCGWTRAL